MSEQPTVPSVHERRVIAENPFVRYVEEDVDPRGDGGRYTYYHLETRSDAVIVIPRLPDGRFILERVYRHPHRRWFVEWPAGGIDVDEEPLAAAARELREETGYQATDLRLLGTLSPLAGLVRIQVTVVVAEGCVRVGDTAHEDMELIEQFIADRDELERLATEADVSGILLFGIHYLDRL